MAATIRGIGQQADTPNGEQPGAGCAVPSELRQFLLQPRDARFEQADFVQQQLHRFADERRDGAVRVSQAGLAYSGLRPLTASPLP